jgi:transposase-like protein
VSNFRGEEKVETCPRCKATMHEVTRIAPLQQQPGLIAYECPSCSYLTSVFLPAGDEPR